MAIRSKRLSAFTLVETVMALWLFTSICLLATALMGTLSRRSREIQNHPIIEWRIFILQMDRIFEQAVQCHLSASDRIVLQLNTGKVAIIERYQTMLRKTSPNGGHEPLLLNLQEVQLTQNGEKINLRVKFEEEGYYAVEWTMFPKTNTS